MVDVDSIVFNITILILGIFDVIVAWILLKIVVFGRSYHLNFKVLFFNFSLSLAFVGIATFIQAFGNLLNFWTNKSELFRTVITIFSGHGWNRCRIIYPFFIIERAMATLNVKTYEKYSNFKLRILSSFFVVSIFQIFCEAEVDPIKILQLDWAINPTILVMKILTKKQLKKHYILFGHSY